MEKEFLSDNEQPENQNNKKNKRNLKLIIFNVIMSVVLALSSVTFVSAAALDMRLLKRNEIDRHEEKEQFEEIVASDSENVTYFLVCGIDLTEHLTDIVMVVCYDIANNQASVLQIPRDTFVGTDVTTGKLNAVYGCAKKGESKIKALIRCINSKFGLPIDHYATVTIQGAKNIIDIIGGVDITLTRQIKLTDDTGKSDIHKYVGPGQVHLDGMWGVAFVRNRKAYVEGDAGRVKAQRSFYAAVLKKMTTLDISQVTNIVTRCFDDVSTDLTLGQMLGYAEKMKQLNLDTVKIMSAPGQAGYYKPSSQRLSYFSIHKQELVNMINEFFMPYEDKAVTADDLKITELHSRYSSEDDDFLQGGNLGEFDTEKDE